jgi:hypothetical protein
MEIGHEDEKSWIEFGGYTSSGLNWVNMTHNQHHWTVPMPRVLIDEEEYEMKADEAILDSGTSLTYLPTKDYETILKYIEAHTNCYEYETYPGYIFCDCKSSSDDVFPTL